ncbi:type III-B CRISPR-associated protein Cas10/Cmr2 [Psychrobacter sp. Ps2]|uniref:type III-B CRISPR-associated protein Cas10/Cmr2 n=1 Tax=Psychrobacter sp. Ps2 TaxID=2790956 RepID=UPI001EDF6160|nr:type III-B CRISPR-associated protein Cas10/Cmr2 [Psychrobacter sp. Ps2]MCG3858837.1 type III-B CRISPR-associated protein Cas10/Cmr2 [Psychrobacter sp. Ps2]
MDVSNQDNQKYFHFTLGPVQSFVAQARRTRDFWAGSFLLSWLAGVAIEAVKVQGGRIIFPIPDEDFLAAINGQLNQNLPKQGGIPNRFMADISNCKDFSGKAVADAITKAWEAVCEQVWRLDEKGLRQDGNQRTRLIWELQTQKFWDISWVITDNNDTSALDKRKNLRTHVPSIEFGYKCMMMTGYQELSGNAAKNSGENRRKYWQTLAKLNKTGLDLSPKEQLCSIAYVKRRFVRIFHLVDTLIDVNGYEINVHGWHVPTNVPSVDYLAATPWLHSVLKHISEGDKQIAKQYATFYEAAYQLIGTHSEAANHIKSIASLLTRRDKHYASLDGSIYFENHILNQKFFEHTESDDRTKAIKALRSLNREIDLEPSPYYAILLMDGDSLGKQMGHQDRQPIISHALNNFTTAAQDIVKDHDGFLIYAGGDDVLALFSLDNAMTAAVALQNNYKACFAAASTDNVKVSSTLSGAINYCHIGSGLTHVLMDSHNLLDNIAKDTTGRNALAVRVWKPSGVAVQWTLPWDKVLQPSVVSEIKQSYDISLPSGVKSFDELPVIHALALAIAQQKHNDDNLSIFSTGFFYKTRQLMVMLQDMMQTKNLKDAQASKLLLAEYLQAGQFGKIKEQDKQRLIGIFEILIEQSRDYRSIIDDGKSELDPASGQQLSGDAGILLRILGQKGLAKGDRA